MISRKTCYSVFVFFLAIPLISWSDSSVLGQAMPESGEPPEDISRLFLRDSEVLLKAKEMQFSIGAVYRKNDVNNNLRQNRNRDFSMPLNFSIGVNQRLEVFFALPLEYREVEVLSVNDSIDNDDSGIGDLSLGLSYRWLNENRLRPSLTSSFVANIPTGDEFSLNNISDVQTGSGFGAASLGFSLTKSIDPAVVFVNFGYQYVLEDSQQGMNIKPGDSFTYGLGAGLSVNSSVAFSARVSGSYQKETVFNDMEIAGSSIEPVDLRLAMTYQLDNKHRFETGVGFGLNDDASDVILDIIYIWNL